MRPVAIADAFRVPLLTAPCDGLAERVLRFAAVECDEGVSE